MAGFVVPQSTSLVVMFKAYLASDHVSEATSKTIAITISKNGGAFGNPNAGATNATEVSSGWYKVTLDTTDTNTTGPLAIRGAVATIDDVGILYQVVKATNGGLTALPDAVAGASGGVPLSADSSGRVDVLKINGTSQTARDIGASVLLSTGTGTGQLDFTSGVVKGNVTQLGGSAIDQTSGLINANVKQISTDATAADNAESFFDGTGYAGTNNVIPSVTTVTGNVNGNVGGNVTGSIGSVASGGIAAASLAADAITAAKLAADVTTELQSGLATSASISALNNLSAAQVNAEVVDALATDTYAEPGQGAPAATTSLSAKINYLYKAWRNKKTQTATTHSLLADDATTVDQKSTVSDDGTTATRGEVASGP